MSPIAAYYVFTASEHARAAAAAHAIPPPRRPSLLERLRTAAAALRLQGPGARPAGAA